MSVSRHISIWEMQDTGQLVHWLSRLGLHTFVRFLLFVGLGVLALVVTCRWRECVAGKQTDPSIGHLGGDMQRADVEDPTFASCTMGILFGIGLSVAICAFTSGLRMPIHVVVSCSASLVGGWMGWAWVRGPKARIRLAVQMPLLLALMAGTTCLLGMLAVEDAPLTFAPAKVTSAEKRRLVDLASNSAQPGGQTRRLRLSEEDIDALLAWGLSVGSPGRKAKVLLAKDAAELMASLRLPHQWGARHVNVRMKGRFRVDSDQAHLAIERCRIGRVEVPGVLVRLGSAILLYALQNDPEIGPLIGSIEVLNIQRGSVEVVAREDPIDRHVGPLLARLGVRQDAAVPVTRIYLQHLVASQPPSTDGDRRFEHFVRAAFILASRRSEEGDPRFENRAAIYALGILLGHSEISRFVGRSVIDAQVAEWMRKQRRHVTLRGRHDWVRHFSVSAALAVLSSGLVSDAVGLLKEELDAGEGGTGFSFADLLADRAGTLFALAACRDDETARAVQRLLSGQWQIGALFPDAADLPEGISDRELQDRYGGVGGAEYERVVRDIEQRLEGTIGKQND